MPERQTSPAEVSPDEVGPDDDRTSPAPDDPSDSDGAQHDDSAALFSPARPATDDDPAPSNGANGAAAFGSSDLFEPRPATPEAPAADDAAPVAPEEPGANDATVVIPPTAAAPDPTAPDPAADGATEVMPPFTAGGPAAGADHYADHDADAEAATTEARIPSDAVGAGDAAEAADAPTEVIPVDGARTARRGRRRALLLAGVLVALVAALYVTDLVQSSGMVPRGTAVAGVDVGGLRPADAEQRVRAAVEPRTSRPVDVAVGDVTSQIDPKAAGLAVDWPATVRQAGAQPLNPFTRVRSFFTRREVGVVSTADPDAVDSALQQLVPVVNRPPAEGTVRFEGVTPVPVPPVPGQELDLEGASEVLQRDWTLGTPVRLPVRVLEPTTSEDDVTKALTDVATPAVSGPVTVEGEKVTGTISPEVIAKALSFRPDPDQGLVPELDKGIVQESLDPQLASSEQPGRDAAISFAGGRPVVTPSQDGRGIDYDATLKDLLAVLTKTGDERRITAVYTAQQAKLTTEELNGYGIREVMGEFTTGGFAPDSGRNIKRAADKINGTVIEPGETFSLNKLTEPRDAAHGYVEAGVIQDGHASRDVGGGVSQVATTTYNAAYFAGMTDVLHKPHSFYISRYPPGREATVVSGPLDLRWRNDTPGGVVVQTVWTPSTLTVRIWGTKRYAVSSTPGPRTNPTQPTQVKIPAGEPCTPSQGAPGFTITDTRTLRDLKTGAVRNEKRTTKYNPAPIVTCGSD
jgi:vancomycin resistance protein YoaR